MTSYLRVRDIPDTALGHPSLGMKSIVMHWTAGTNKVSSLDKEYYHFIIDGNGQVHLGNKPVAANATKSYRAGTYVAHTRNFNENSIGVSIAGFHGFVPSPLNVGRMAANEVQVAVLVNLVAKLALHHNIPVAPHTTLSHAEVQPTLNIKQNGKIDFVWLPGLNLKTAIDPVLLGNMLRERIRGVRGTLTYTHAPAPKPITSPAPKPITSPAPKPITSPTLPKPITSPTLPKPTLPKPKPNIFDVLRKLFTKSTTPKQERPKTMTAAIPSLPSNDEEVSPKGNMLEGKKTYITTIFGIISGIIAILQGNSSLPEILQVLGDIVNILGFNPSNAGPAVIGFAAIATTRMSITKLLRIMQELWPIVQEIRKLAAEAKKK